MAYNPYLNTPLTSGQPTQVLQPSSGSNYYGNYGNNNYTNYVQPLTPVQTNGSLMTVIVNNEQDVEMYPIAAGTTVMLISFEKQKFWLKSRGTDGVPMPIRCFPFKEESTSVRNQNGSVSREEFDSLSAKLNKLLEELGGAKGNE